MPKPITVKVDALPKFPCNDCGTDVLEIGDWYLARSEIWEHELGLGWDDNLCLACLEKRMGRPLRRGINDLVPASTFFPGQPQLSARLMGLWKSKNTGRPRRKSPPRNST